MRGVVKSKAAPDIQFEGFTGVLGGTSDISPRKYFQLWWLTMSVLSPGFAG